MSVLILILDNLDDSLPMVLCILLYKNLLNCYHIKSPLFIYNIITIIKYRKIYIITKAFTYKM